MNVAELQHQTDTYVFNTPTGCQDWFPSTGPAGCDALLEVHFCSQREIKSHLPGVPPTGRVHPQKLGSTSVAEILAQSTRHLHHCTATSGVKKNATSNAGKQSGGQIHRLGGFMTAFQ